ncbi:putative transcriptional regulator [Sodalis glossinidius str. 'morsitans']|uniref:Transcriptional regulator n=1 Tax=Sodalis glossinidius (strain morsitans) TaxID=343509 RepID=Q2NVD4_SODGM|nr:putative transcriptional regulator [Sodalis glossinidius str. 'morsitans']
MRYRHSLKRTVWVLKENFNDLMAFLVVAEERSFNRATARLGLSQSALSHSMHNLEERMGIRLLTRTTHSVSPTQAGDRLLARIGPHFNDIEIELNAMKDMRDVPAGNIRITAGEHATDYILWPVLRTFMPQWPDIQVEVTVDNALTDIVSHRFDAGVRLEEQGGQRYGGDPDRSANEDGGRRITRLFHPPSTTADAIGSATPPLYLDALVDAGRADALGICTRLQRIAGTD